MTVSVIPRATYRLQLHREFTLDQAAELVPYLAELGISHCYTSPFLAARPGSAHGYDVVDHTTLNPEVGDWQSFERFTRALHEHGMGLMADLVPNHMGVGGADNAWWLDVLENGQASQYAPYFDIDWQPAKKEMRGKVLLPFLADRYGTVLENGELRLVFDPEEGSFNVWYGPHRLPIDPAAYPTILGYRLDRIDAALGEENPDLWEYQSIITALGHLPPTRETASKACEERQRDKEIHKHRLAALCDREPGIPAFINETVSLFNGTPGIPRSFDRLHGLLERQPYRLAFWRVAADEINYRRFFDINDLAGLCMEHPEVFDATHQLILELISGGKIQALRIDHPDGLYDPLTYLQHLRGKCREALAQGRKGGAEGGEAGEQEPPYVAVEKILGWRELLPADWPVQGTTGYDFSNQVNGLFVNPAGERLLDRIYRRFTGRSTKFDDELYAARKLIMKVELSSELTVLANLLNTISESDRHTRDFTRNGLRDALTEVAACFPTYRTYVAPDRVADDDRHHIVHAVARARRRNPAVSSSLFDFVRALLLLGEGLAKAWEHDRRVVRLAMKFQQFTAPVMAKSLEDTVFYTFNRLLSLNDVGGDPSRFGVSVGAFHAASRERCETWPHAMLAGSTHDSKRSEDVRARLNVLSELPDEWRVHLARWSRLNRAKKRDLGEGPAPSRNDEYYLYQTMLGAWPPDAAEDAGREEFAGRVTDHMLKAVREAKVHTSWTNPDPDYEGAVMAFIEKILRMPEGRRFQDDFVPFAQRVAYWGRFNSLSQTLLRLTAPGVPDLYQGAELWQLTLVDPDNRRPVDYVHRRRLLGELRKAANGPESRCALCRELVRNIDDGCAKLYLIWQVLGLRRENPALFRDGSYTPLAAEGERADHICAFARGDANATLVTVAPRWFATLAGTTGTVPLGKEVWGDTLIETPEDRTGIRYRNLFTGESIRVVSREGRHFLPAAHLFKHFPVALVHRAATSPAGGRG